MTGDEDTNKAIDILGEQGVVKMNQEFRAKLERRATRLAKRVDEYKAKMEGKEQDFTFHVGFDCGCHAGKLEAILTILEEANNYE